MVQVEGWFISVEKDPAGNVSHCQMMNPYFTEKGPVLLTFTLSRDQRALAVVVDRATPPPASDAPGKGPVLSGSGVVNEGTYAFDDGPAVRVPALGRGEVLRLELPDWKAFRAGLAGAKTIAVSGEGRSRRFNLYGTQDAVPALEECAQRGALPPRVPVPKPGTVRSPAPGADTGASPAPRSEAGAAPATAAGPSGPPPGDAAGEGSDTGATSAPPGFGKRRGQP